MTVDTGSYSWDARDYHANSSAQARWGLELIEGLRLSGHEHVLDIGSGDGKLTSQLAARVPRGAVLGIDSSDEMVLFAQQMFPAEDFPNLSFRVMDAKEMAFEEAFDVVFSNATLHWITGHEPVIAGIARSLRRGGRVVLQMGGRGNAQGIVEAIDRITGRGPWKPHYEGFTLPYGFYGPEEYRRWLEKAGLRAIRAQLIPKDMVHDSREGLEAWIRTTWLPYLQRIPGNCREAFVREVVGAYLEAHPVDSCGRTHVAMIRLEVEAVREGN